jgi:hypothetical protein
MQLAATFQQLLAAAGEDEIGRSDFSTKILLQNLCHKDATKRHTIAYLILSNDWKFLAGAVERNLTNKSLQ